MWFEDIKFVGQFLSVERHLTLPFINLRHYGYLIRARPRCVDVLQRGVNGFQGTQDPITAVTAAPHMLLIGRSSGDVLCYTLPDLVSAGSHAHPYHFS